VQNLTGFHIEHDECGRPVLLWHGDEPLVARRTLRLCQRRLFLLIDRPMPILNCKPAAVQRRRDQL
jgi:hypothetical protein